jgi:Sap, sulfolipid-1-addressing protein
MPPQFVAAGANSFLDLLPLALWSALYPTLLAMAVLIMQRPSPRRMLIAYYLGGLVASFSAAAVLIGAFKAGRSLGASNATVGPAVDIAVGLVALTVFWVLLTGRDKALRERRARKKELRHPEKQGHEPWSRRMMERESLGLTFVVALALNLPGAAYLVALKDIAESSAGTGQIVLWVVLYNLIMFTLLEVPILGYIFAPDATRARVEAFNDWLGGHGRQIAMALLVTAGAFLVARGLITAL